MIQNFITSPSDLFTSRDIETNKKGKLTSPQLTNIQLTLSKEKRILKNLLKIWYPLGFIICVILYTLDSPILISGNVWMWCAVALPFLIPLFILLAVTKKTKLPVNNSCLAITGIVKKIHLISEGEHAYSIELNKIKFFVSEYIFNLIKKMICMFFIIYNLSVTK